MHLCRECAGRDQARQVNTIATDLDIPSREVQSLAYELALETGCVGSATKGPAAAHRPAVLPGTDPGGGDQRPAPSGAGDLSGRGTVAADLGPAQATQVARRERAAVADDRLRAIREVVNNTLPRQPKPEAPKAGEPDSGDPEVGYLMEVRLDSQGAMVTVELWNIFWQEDWPGGSWWDLKGKSLLDTRRLPTENLEDPKDPDWWLEGLRETYDCPIGLFSGWTLRRGE